MGRAGQVQSVAATAIAFLSGKQNSDGGFGDSPSTVHDTSNVLLALTDLEALNAVRIEDASSYLLTRQTAAGDWAGSTYATALAAKALQRLNIGNWAVNLIALQPAQPSDGDLVELGFSVSNDTNQPMPATVLRVLDGNLQIGPDLNVPALAAGQSRELSLFWDTLGLPGLHSIAALVDPDAVELETSERDNSSVTDVTVAGAPAGIDLSINQEDVAVMPANPTLLPTTLGFATAIRNLGLSDTAAVRVQLRAGSRSGTLLEEQFFDIPGRGSVAANFSYELFDPGINQFVIVVDSDDQYQETRENNNSVTVRVGTESTLDLVVSTADISADTAAAIIGEDVTFNIELRNRGTLDSPSNAVRYLITDGVSTTELATNSIQIDAGGTITQELVWRVDREGALTFTVELDPDNLLPELFEDNNTASFSFSAGQANGPNLVASFRDFTFDPQPGLEARPVTLTALVRNTGNAAADNVEVGFYDGDPEQGGVLIESLQSIPSLAAGATASVSVTWAALPDSQDKLLFVALDPNDSIAEFSETDNQAFNILPVLNLADLALSPGDITLSPAFPKSGDAVEIAVRVANLGQQSASNTVVRLFDREPGLGGSQLGGDLSLDLGGNDSGVVNFSITLPANATATQTLYVEVDPDDQILEQTELNNFAIREIAIQDGNFAVSERYISPNGDGVQDDTEFFFRLQQATDVEIAVIDENDRVVRRFTGSEWNAVEGGQLLWDGLDEFGRVVRDGLYQLQVQDLAGPVLGAAAVTVDNNRSPLLRAEGTEFTSYSNLTCPIDSANLIISEDDDSIVFFVFRDTEALLSGVYRMDGNGGNIQTLYTDADFGVDGDLRGVEANDDLTLLHSVVFVGRDRQHWISDGNGENRRQLPVSRDANFVGFGPDDQTVIMRTAGLFETVPVAGGDPVILADFGDYPVSSIMSPDRHRVLVDFPDEATRTRRLSVIDLQNRSQTVLLEQVVPPNDYLGDSDFWDYSWSPDGSRVAVVSSQTQDVFVFNQNGNLLNTVSWADIVTGTRIRSMVEPQWSSVSNELGFLIVFDADTDDGPDADQGGLFLVDLDAETVERVYAFPLNRGGGGDEELASLSLDGLIDSIIPSANAQAAERFLPSTSFSEFLWAPNERTWLLRAREFETGSGSSRNWPMAAFFLDGDREPQRVFQVFANAERREAYRFSPSGQQLLYSSSRESTDPNSVCDGFWDTWTFRSLLNLTTDLRAIRSDRLGGILLSGTASDANFKQYRLEYAFADMPDVWRPIQPSSGQNVIDDQFTVWIPPSPGSYFVRLSATDLAGNQRQKITRVSWNETPAITDLYRAPELFSPNGDGIADLSSVQYRSLTPVHLEFDFYDIGGGLVRNIVRDHSEIGQTFQLNWDGRDDSGLLLADGEYRMTAQNYEFFFHIDTTFPEVNFSLQDVYQAEEQFDSEGNSLGLFATAQAQLDWSLLDLNYTDSVIEWASASSPSDWQVFADPDPARKEADGKIIGRKQLALSTSDRYRDEVSGRRYRAIAADGAGNRTVVSLGPVAEQLMVVGFGAHRPNLSSALASQLNVLNDDAGLIDTLNATGGWFERLAPIPYAEMGNNDGVAPAVRSIFGETRFQIKETVAARLTSLEVQYRSLDETQWRGSNPDRYFDDARLFSAAPIERSSASEVDIAFHAVWKQPADIDPDRDYVIRLKGLDAAGGEHLSNVFRVRFTEKLSFKGLRRDAAAEDIALIDRLLGGFPSAEDYVLWGRVSSVDPISTVRVLVSSSDDPRYAVEREIGVFNNAINAFAVKTGDLSSCQNYSARVIGIVEPRLDPQSGELLPGRRFESQSGSFQLLCLELAVRVEPVIAAVCNSASPQALRIEFSPQSTDGAPLQLLSLSTEDAQDVLFNVNEPTSAPRPRRGNEPVFNYEFILDTSDMAPGRRTFRARLLNKNDEEITENVSLVIDHVAPQAAINFPAAGDKVCGVPRVVNIDGQSETFNVMSLEGLIQDDVSLGYFLEFNPGSEYNAATARRFHDSNSDLNLNSFQAASAQGPTPVVLDSVEASRPVNRVSPAFSGNRKAGSLGELFNITGENNVRLHVYDRGGHHICTDRSFTFDGNVQLASLSLDRALFSPNQDGVADSVELAYVLDESARLDAEIFAATIGADKVPRITGNVLRVIASDLPVLAGASRVAWDGTDAAGTPLADGLYAIRLSFTDGCGNRRREARFVEVDNTEPALNLLFPLSTSQLPLMTEVQGTVTDKNFNDYRVEVGRGSDPDTWLQIAADRRAVSEAGVLGSWNTFGLQDDYTLRVTAADKVGNRTELRIPLTLTEPLELVSYLEAVEPLFSPNGDGRRERTSIRFGLEQEVVASLGILQQGQVVRELLVEQSFEPGPRALSWNGDDAIGESVADGVYQAQLSVGLASDPLVSQTEQITITVDGGLPTVEITQPGNGFIRPGLPVVGTISDVHLQSYSLSIADNADNPLWEEIASGNLNQLNRSLAPLSAELEGSYVLRVTALDLAENRVEQIIPFTLDKTAPAVSLTVPANNAYVNGQAPLAISAALTEDNPAAYRLEFSAPGSNTATEIASGQDFPLPEVLTQWDVAAVSDGVYNLRFTVEDLAGNTGVVEQLLTIDKTPPVASITTPQNNGYITEGALIEGVASDLNLDEYRIEIAPGAVASAEQYSLLGTGVVPVDQGGLLEISVLPADGEYSLRLQVDDLAGNQSEALVQVVVDTSAPAQVGNLSAAIENDSDVRLNWDDNAESDLAGYFVFRDGVQVTPQPIDVSEYVDVGVAQGRHQYTLRAIDNAGNTSPDSLAAEVVIDLLPPTVSISAPTAGSEVNGLVDIRGTATSLDDFKEYRLYTARGDAPEIRQLLRRSPVPVQAQSLGEWNTISLPEGAAYVITLEGEDINGNIATEQATVSIDNLAPVQPTGLTLTTNGANVNLSWNANPETDLLGYLVFRNDRIANATGTVVGDLQPYVIVPNAYADLTLPDGLYSYTIVAIDDAGNLSEASLPADATIDTRIPQANIVQPTDGIEFEQPLYVLATTQDNDVATVQFQYRALGSSLWIDLEADTELPFDLDFDPSALGLNLGDYELTAVATDQNDQTDANPGFITLKYRDLTAPASAADLLARVSAGDVSLSWSANNDADLAGYHIERVDVDQVTTRLTTDLLQVSSYDDFDLADGVYRYQVIAVDQSGNESNVSEQAVAVIYTPVFEAFPVPTRQTAVTINGRGVTRATVNTTLTNSAGSVELAPLDTDAEGLFVLAASLEPGANRFVVRMTDADGNVSKSASLNIFRGDAPSRPTGLAGSANDTEVSLSWNPNPETDIAGYRVFRNGATALADQAVTGLSATASSAFSGNTGPRAIDGNPSTFWQTPFPYQDQWIAIDWVEPRLLTEIVLNWRYSSGVLSDYDIEADFQGSWVVLQEVRAARRELEQKVLLAAPYMTTKIRLVVRENRFFSLSEIVPVHSPLVEATAFVETAPNGVQEYTVTAVNTLGFESAASAPAELSIGDVTPPEAVTLSAVADGTDVDLSWDASTSTDVSAYDLYRDAVLIAGITDLGNLSYRDLGLPNGVYTYHVVVRDQVGNQSVPSNAVSVTIDAPGSFDLSVSAAAEGSALTLDWVAPSGISPNQYRIFRAETAGGVYAEIGQVAGSVLSYADAGLENETARHYVVIAVDASAAVSTVSIEASGTPRDTAAPVLPVLLAPTRAGTIYLTTDDRVTITGSTEAGANVELVADGRNLLTTALAEPEVSYTQLRNLDSYSLSPDGQSLLYADRFPSRIRLYDFATETERQIYGSPENVDLNPQWFSDGKRIVFIDESASESRLFVRILDIADASLVDVTDPVTSNIVFATPSPDGAQLLLLGSFDDPGQSGLWLFDLNTGGKTLLREGRPYSFFVPVWSPDGNQVAYLNQDASPRTIEVYDLEGMVFQVVGEMTYSRSQLSWSPDSKALIYDRYDSIIRPDVISRYTPATGLTDILLSDPNANLRDPRWSPDGRQIAYFDTSSRQLHIRDIDTGADNILEDARGFTGLEQWGRSGQLLVFADFSFARLAPPGFFEFAGVDLKLGENEFAALATDAVGNVSSLADSIVVARSLGDLADLSVRPEDIVLLPAVPSVNQTARVGITIHNLGRRSSEPASFSVLAIDPTGQSIELVAPAVIGSLAPNRSRTVTADWPLGDTAGEYTLVVFVDGENSIAELNEANNTVIMPQLVGGEGGLSSTIALDAAEYTSGQPASIAFEISNSSDRFNGHYEVRIEDGQGVSVAQLRAEPVQNLLFGQSIVSTLEWNTSTTFAGAYRARLRVWDAENQLLVSESADFNINPSFLVEADVVTDRTRYSGNGNVRVTGTVNYPTGNVVLDGASASLRIFGINGGILLETVEPLAVLIPGASASVSADWNTGLQSVGLYRVEIEVTQDARSVARAQSEFSIDADVLRLSGSLALADDSPDAGVIQQVSFSIENLGNAAIQQLPATISLLDPNAQAVLQSEVLQVDIGVNDASTGSVGFDTANLALVNYNLLLQVEVPDANGQPSLLNLASTSFTLQDRSPPLVTLLRPVASGFINSAEEMRFTAEDRLTAIALTAFQIDGGDWVGAVVRDATNNEYGADLPVLSETTHSIRARATDLAGNTGFSATVSFTVDNTAPQIAVEGVSDGVVYLDPVAPIITITETNLAETYIAINNEPFVSGTAIVAEGQYDLFVDVTDLAGNIAQTFLSFIIDGGAPLIEINGVADGQIVNTSVTPEIVVTDANLTQTSITLNGEGFVSGTEIIEEGEYQLQVTAADIAGNTTTQTLDFRIDLTAPTLVVSVPDDGAMVDAAMISISGQTEPAAIVALTAADMTRTSVVADASGLFVFDGVNLLVGDNLFTLTATDMAGNNSDELALSVIRIVAQQVELSGSLAVRPRVLAWMPGAYRRHDQTTTLPLEQMLVELFAEKGIDYQLTDNEADFKQALYSQRYNVVVIADAHPRGYRPGRNGYCYYDYHRRRHHGAGDDDDHDDDDDDEHEDDDDDDGYDDDDHGGYGNHYRRYRPRHLHLSHALKNRLRLNVAGGMGLVMISTHPYHGNNLSDVFGARIKGHGSVGPDGQIALIDSPLGEARVLARSSRGVRLKNLGGITVGTYQPEEKPALVINTYRSGKTALLGFDPAGLDDTEQAKTLLSDLFNFAAPQSLATFPGSVVDLQWTVSQAEPPLDVNLTQISDPQIGLLNVLDGEIVDAQTAVWQRIIEAEQDVFDAVIRLPFEKGDFSISADLSANVDGNLTSLQVAELLVSTERDLDDLGAALLTTMAAVEVDRRWEARLLRLATWLVRLALESPRDSRYAVDAALWYLTHAYKLVGQIRPGLFEVQSEIGLVYRLYQLERYRLGVDAGDW